MPQEQWQQSDRQMIDLQSKPFRQTEIQGQGIAALGQFEADIAQLKHAVDGMGGQVCLPTHFDSVQTSVSLF
jgi:hypothetical protein